MRRAHLLAVAAALALAALPAAAAVGVETSTGPYGERCVGVHTGDGGSGSTVVACAAKGVASPHALDCVVYVDAGGATCIGIADPQ